MTLVVKRVRNASQVRFKQLVLERIVESLRVLVPFVVIVYNTYWTSNNFLRFGRPCSNQITYSSCTGSCCQQTPNQKHLG